MTSEQENADQVIWAIGGRRTRSLVHAYLNEEEFKKGICLCGRDIRPLMRFDEWNLSEESHAEYTCPSCRERLQFIPFISKVNRKSERKN